LSVDAAGGYDSIALLQLLHHRFVFLLPPALWPYHDEVKKPEDDYQKDNHGPDAAAAFFPFGCRREAAAEKYQDRDKQSRDETGFQYFIHFPS